MIEILKAFISGMFAGMANDQARRKDYKGTKWRAEIALKWATNPVTKFFAHAVSAKAEMLGRNSLRARHHIDTALRLYEAHPEIREISDSEVVVRDLTEMRDR